MRDPHDEARLDAIDALSALLALREIQPPPITSAVTFK